MITEQSAIKLYQENIAQAAKHFRAENGKRGTEYNYYNGAAHGIGEVLDYEYQRIEAEIEKALTAGNSQG